MALINGGPVSKDVNSVIIPTVLQMSRDIIDKLTHITCLYDRYWSKEPGRITLPLCVFYVRKYQEQWVNELSQKRVILYERETTTSKEAADVLRPAVMQSAVDNIVGRPKQYTMEIIIPFQPAQMLKDYLNDITQLTLGLIDIFGPAGSTLNDVKSVLSQIQMGVQYASQAAGAVESFAQDEAQFINKSSLEAMAEAKRIYTMKTWYGYYYKYVAISNLTIEKNALEDSYFRANMTVQEMPVLTVRKPEDAQAGPVSRGVIGTVGEALERALVEPLLWLTRARHGSGEK